MLTILVVDDDRVNCDMLQSVFTRQGYRVITGTSGREALTLFREHRPRVTLLDLRMPEMDGIQVLREIRALNPRAAVVILGGGATEDQENQARELRVSDFLRKGLSLDVLVNAVNQLAQQPYEQHSRDLPALVDGSDDTASRKGNSILIVEDQSSVRDLLLRFLELRGFQAKAASTGQEALDMIRTDPPQVVLLDFFLPDINGVEVLRTIRNEGQDCGVIALTGCQSEDLLQDAWDLGLHEVLNKPVDLERLLTTIQLVLVLQEC